MEVKAYDKVNSLHQRKAYLEIDQENVNESVFFFFFLKILNHLEFGHCRLLEMVWSAVS